MWYFVGYHHQRLPVQRSPEDAAGLSGDEQHGLHPEHPHAVGGRVGAGRRLQGPCHAWLLNLFQRSNFERGKLTGQQSGQGIIQLLFSGFLGTDTFNIQVILTLGGGQAPG